MLRELARGGMDPTPWARCRLASESTGLQRTYEEFAQHYATVIVPARPAAPPGQGEDRSRPVAELRPLPAAPYASTVALAGVSPVARLQGHGDAKGSAKGMCPLAS